jgi:hypothetical protein
LALSGC